MMENMDANQERLEANRKGDPEELKEIMNTNQAKTDVNLKEMREEIHFIQTEHPTLTGKRHDVH
jgi:hypothetical protein